MSHMLTLSNTTSLMMGRPSGLCILAPINWQPRRNSLSYRFLSSGSIGFHCSERRTRECRGLDLNREELSVRCAAL